ncbi:MAG: hypothetical protein ACAH88_00975 [Roseimicrobium sp.]
MRDSERRLLMVFVLLAAVIGGVLLGQRLLQWDHRLDRLERDLELAQMESDALIGQSALWNDRSAWIMRTQPAAANGLDASKSLLDSLSYAAKGGGIDITKTQINEEVRTGYYRQFGVTFTVKGELPKILEWIYSTLKPDNFFVVPLLKITPDKGESQDVIAQVTFQRRYTPEYATAGNPAQAQPQPQPPPQEVGAP